MIERDVWNKEFRPIHINKNKLKKQSERYRMDVRFALGRIKTEDDFERDKQRILSM
jgi:hypothetical protein